MLKRDGTKPKIPLQLMLITVSGLFEVCNQQNGSREESDSPGWYSLWGTRWRTRRRRHLSHDSWALSACPARPAYARTADSVWRTGSSDRRGASCRTPGGHLFRWPKLKGRKPLVFNWDVRKKERDSERASERESERETEEASWFDAPYVSLDVVKDLWGGILLLQVFPESDHTVFVHLHPGRRLPQDKGGECKKKKMRKNN